MEQARYCRKCLLQEMQETEFWENMRSYIAHIPEEKKVSEPVLARRLAVCKDCEELISGMCRLCGCYVELRAAMRIRSCPHVPAKWCKEEGDSDEE